MRTSHLREVLLCKASIEVSFGSEIKNDSLVLRVH